MRIPVFARRADPSVDKPILHKSLSYIEQQIALGWADWIDPKDFRKGIICRELLNFGGRPKPQPITIGNVLPTIEPGGTKFRDPVTNRTTRAMRAGLRLRARFWAKASAIA